MAVTLLPTPPNPNSPATFDTLAYPFTLALYNMAPEINAALAKMGLYAARSGTANAIVLTGVLLAGTTPVPTGTAVRFRAGAANTGATTINLDGSGAVACVTVTGVALPAGYIRTDIDTTAVFDGTNWVVYREVERGSNANGAYTRFADGSQICVLAVTSSTGADVSVTFPAAFGAAPRVCLGVNSSGAFAISPRFTGLTASGMSVSAFNSSNARVAAQIEAHAIGVWF